MKKCKCGKKFIRKEVREARNTVKRRFSNHFHHGVPEKEYGICSNHHYTAIKTINTRWDPCTKCDSKNKKEKTKRTRLPTLFKDELNKFKEEMKENFEKIVEQRVEKEVKRRLKNLHIDTSNHSIVMRKTPKTAPHTRSGTDTDSTIELPSPKTAPAFRPVKKVRIRTPGTPFSPPPPPPSPPTPSSSALSPPSIMDSLPPLHPGVQMPMTFMRTHSLENMRQVSETPSLFSPTPSPMLAPRELIKERDRSRLVLFKDYKSLERPMLYVPTNVPPTPPIMPQLPKKKKIRRKRKS